MHLSEQPAENAQSIEAYGLTPTGVLDEAGALSPRLSVVHATHLTPTDIARLGEAGVSAVFCPTTEADLGDGIGPARELADAGAHIALGSDQQVVLDPFREVQGLESGERLRSLRRGRFTPVELDQIRAAHGYTSLGLAGGVSVGAFADLIEIDTSSVRTLGAEVLQLAFCATAADVRRVFVGGTLVANQGRLADGRSPAMMLRDALAGLED